MVTAILFMLLAIAIIMGGATILLRTAKKPFIPDNIKSAEQLDQEDIDDYN